MKRNVAYKILDPVDDVPVPRTAHHEIWDAAMNAKGRWVPVELDSKLAAKKLVSNVLARNTNLTDALGTYEALQRENTVYIRFTKKEEKPPYIVKV